jgi:hypothetical protein
VIIADQSEIIDVNLSTDCAVADVVAAPPMSRTLRRANHDQRFDGPAPFAAVSVNLKIDVQRVGLNLCKGGLGPAYWARVSLRERERRILKTHVDFLRLAEICVKRGTLRWRLGRYDRPKGSCAHWILYKSAHLLCIKLLTRPQLCTRLLS